MDERAYELKQIQTSHDLLTKEYVDAGEGTKRDIWLLKYLATSIRPYSRRWRDGTLRAIRHAIKALEKEGEA